MRQYNPFSYIRKADPDHALLVALSPKRAQADISSIHAFCVELAGIQGKITEPQAGLIRLEWWRERVREMAEDGQTSAHPLLPFLHETVTARGISLPMLHAVIDGRGAALSGWQPQSMTELTKQIRASYCTGMNLWAHILDVPPHHIEAQCIAFTILAHLRSAPWDRGENICPIPRDILARFDLHAEQYHSTPVEKLIPVWEMMGGHAENLLIGTEGSDLKLFRAHRKLCHIYLGALKKAGYHPYALRPVPFKALRLLFS